MKHCINENFFEKIDTEEKAYWLGFIAADGCIYKMSKTAYRFQINLKEEDCSFLYKLNQAVESDYPINIKDVGNSKTCQLKIANKIFSENLMKHGITPKKSLIVKMPNLKKNLIRHFIRGYFDGDGCITYHFSRTGRLRYRFNIVGGEDMLLAINKHLDCSIYDINHSLAKSLETASKQKIINIYNYLYKDSNIYLDRKKQKFDELLSLFAEMQLKEQSELTEKGLEP